MSLWGFPPTPRWRNRQKIENAWLKTGKEMTEIDNRILTEVAVSLLVLITVI